MCALRSALCSSWLRIFLARNRLRVILANLGLASELQSLRHGPRLMDVFNWDPLEFRDPHLDVFAILVEISGLFGRVED